MKLAVFKGFENSKNGLTTARWEADRDSLKLLAKSADTAAKSLKALDKFTGRQLAEAFGADGTIDATTKAGKAIFAAVTAQQELSDLLVQLGKNLDSISRHDADMRAANPQYKGVDSALRDEVDDFRLLCDRRATEINHLAYQMKDFAVHLAANGQNADPNVVAILKAKVDELLPRQALAMHGTADALATVSEEVSGKLRPLAEKIDAFKRNPSATVNSQAYEALRSNIRTMKAAIVDIRTNGIAVNGGRMMVAKDILNALETEVAKAEQLFETARKEVKQTVLANYLGTATKLFCEDDPYEYQRSFGNKQLTTMLQLRDETLVAGKSSSAPDAGMSAKDIKRLPPAQLQQVKADLMRQFNRLQWLDLVTGQNDRHWENYFVHVDRDTHKVTLKGIDNDAGYSQFRTGAVKFSFDKDRSEVFMLLLRRLARDIDSRNADAVYNRLLHDQGITVDSKGKVTVDASKLADKTIGSCLAHLVGAHSLAIPDKIDRETYDSLIALKQDPARRKEYLDSIRPRLSPASYAAAESRLDDVIAHAEELGRQGKIVEAGGWANVQEQPLATGKVTVYKQNAEAKRLGGEIAQDVNELFCPSYFARDKIDKLFN